MSDPMDETDRHLPTPPRNVALAADIRERIADRLAIMRPARFVAGFIDRLEAQGETVLARLFTIATDTGTEDGPDGEPRPRVPFAVQLKAIDMILKLAKSEEVMEVAMGLKRQVGRPGSDAEAEAAKQAAEWADIVDMEEVPPGSAQFRAAEPDDE